MASGEDRLLDHLDADGIALPRRCYRAHPDRLDDGTAVDPCAPNRFSLGRLARRTAPPGQASEIGMLYVGATPAAALMESLFRCGQAVVYGTRLYLPPSVLAGWCLSTLQLRKPLKVIPLELQERTAWVTDPKRDERWRGIINTADYPATWAAAAAVAAQLQAAKRECTGFAWTSVQCRRSGLVYLTYDPPCGAGCWKLSKTIALDTAKGHALIRQWLKRVGWTWLTRGPAGSQPTAKDADAI